MHAAFLAWVRSRRSMRGSACTGVLFCARDARDCATQRLSRLEDKIDALPRLETKIDALLKSLAGNNQDAPQLRALTPGLIAASPALTALQRAREGRSSDSLDAPRASTDGTREQFRWLESELRT